MPSIWAFIGFFLFSLIGAYFYYRALSEVAGRRAEEDVAGFRDDELLAGLQPVATVAFRRSVALAAGEDLAVSALPDGSLRLERLALPLKATRPLSDEAREAFHAHQILVMGIACESAPSLEPGPFPWPRAEELEARLLEEWPGYADRLARIKHLATQERPLYPPLTLKRVPLGSADEEGIEGGRPGASGEDPPTRSDAPLEEIRRKERDPEKDRGLRIEMGEHVEDESRRWQGEKRDEVAGEEMEIPRGPIDVARSDTPVFHAVRPQSKPLDRAADSEGLRYDEWDYTESRYRRNYCRVVVHAPPAAVREENRLLTMLQGKRQVVREVIRLFDSLRPLPQRRGRQADGDAVDLDAWVDTAVQMKCGGSVNENVYEQHIRHERSVAVTLLADVSASTEQWAGRRRAFEIGMETAALFCMGQRVLGDQTEVLGFSGSGPQNVRIGNIKSFDEPWTRTVFDRLDQIQPQDFTRLGAAIRHATASLERRPVRHKLLVVLSDARPQDEDGYEGQYGWADTRRALDEAKKKGVLPYCLTLDRAAGPHLRLLFQRNYAIHLDPETLPLKLPAVFCKLTQLN